MKFLRRFISTALVATRAELLPVKARRGFLKGAWWSLYPFSAYWRGNHEPVISNYLDALGNWQGKHCWDLGCHFGYFSIGLARRIGSSGSVNAFDPNPVAMKRLLLHKRRNGATNLHAHQLGASDVNGTARFFSYNGFQDTASHLQFTNEGINASIPCISISTRRLDDMVAEGAIEAPDFIKIDVEGHGHKALEGMLQSIRAKHPMIIIGIHCDEELDAVRTLLSPLGYSWKSFEPDWDENARPVKNTDLLCTAK